MGNDCGSLHLMTSVVDVTTLHNSPSTVTLVLPEVCPFPDNSDLRCAPLIVMVAPGRASAGSTDVTEGKMWFDVCGE